METNNNNDEVLVKHHVNVTNTRVNTEEYVSVLDTITNTFGESVLTTVKNLDNFDETVETLKNDTKENFFTGVEIVSEGLPVLLICKEIRKSITAIEGIESLFGKNDKTYKRLTHQLAFINSTFNIFIDDDRVANIEKKYNLKNEHPGSAQLIKDMLENSEETQKLLNGFHVETGKNVEIAISEKIEELSSKWENFTEKSDEEKRKIAIEKLIYFAFFNTGKPGFLSSKPSLEDLAEMANAKNLHMVLRASRLKTLEDLFNLRDKKNDVFSKIAGVIFTEHGSYAENEDQEAVFIAEEIYRVRNKDFMIIGQPNGTHRSFPNPNIETFQK